MILEKKDYSGIDILKIAFKLSPICVALQLAIVLLQAILTTAIIALSTAFFVDTAISIFSGHSMAQSIYFSLALILITVGANSILSSLPRLLESRITFSLERNLKPAIMEIQASLNYKHIEDANSWELIKRVVDEMTETFQSGIRAYTSMIRNIVAVISILGLVLTQVWWAALIVAFVSIPLFWIAIWAGQRNYDAEVQTRKYERRYSYCTDDVLTSREAVDERTLFGYANEITRRYLEQFEIARKIQLKVSIKMWIAMKSPSICMAVVALMIAFTLINPTLSGNVSPGLFMGIVAAVFGMVSTIGWSLQDAT